MNKKAYKNFIKFGCLIGLLTLENLAVGQVTSKISLLSRNLGRSMLASRKLCIDPNIRAFSGSSDQDNNNKNKLSLNKLALEREKLFSYHPEGDLKNEDARLAKFEQILKDALEKQKEEIINEMPWDRKLAGKQVIAEFIKQGYSKEQAEAKLEELDQLVDQKRAMMRVPYIAGIVLPVVAVPATLALVYNEPFYNAVLELWPFLETNSWDWSEPVVQTLATVQMAVGAMCYSASSLGMKNQEERRNRVLKEIMRKKGVSDRTSDKFLKVDE